MLIAFAAPLVARNNRFGTKKWLKIKVKLDDSQ
jgi:hypothetical protein